MSYMSFKMDFSKHEFLLVCDADHERSHYGRVAAIQRMIRETFPGIRIRYHSYGDTTNLPVEQRRTCYRVGAPVRDIPQIPLLENNPHGPFAQGVANRSLMTDLFTFVYDSQSPNMVMVISGDRDFCRPLDTITRMGYTTMLVCNPETTNAVLLGSVTLVYDWRLIEQHGFHAGPSPPPAMVPSLPRIKNLHVPRTFVMWDTDSVPFPQHLYQDNANIILLNHVISPNVQVLGNVAFRVYGRFLPAIHRRSSLVAYTETTTAENMKEYHLESNFIADVGDFVCHNRNVVSNVVIITNNNNFGELIAWLSNMGYRTVLVGATDKFMRDAAQVNVMPPMWVET